MLRATDALNALTLVLEYVNFVNLSIKIYLSVSSFKTARPQPPCLIFCTNAVTTVIRNSIVLYEIVQSRMLECFPNRIPVVILNNMYLSRSMQYT